MENLYLIGTEASQEIVRQQMKHRQKVAAQPIDNVFESAQMDPFVAVSLLLFLLKKKGTQPDINRL